jgi:hypothetical protein
LGSSVKNPSIRPLALCRSGSIKIENSTTPIKRRIGLPKKTDETLLLFAVETFFFDDKDFALKGKTEVNWEV